MISICIPSIKDNCDEQIRQIKKSIIPGNYFYDVFSVNKQQSAAKNRNECIEGSYGYLICMMEQVL